MNTWLARLLALAGGLAAALAFPPFGVLPGLLGYALLLRLVDTNGPRPRRSAFFRGWLAGVGYFGLGVGWITEPFMVDAAEQGWMAPFALLLMAGGLALFWGFAALVFRIVRAPGWTRLLAFAASLSAFEWLRGHVFTGFPWNLPGETWAAGSAPSQAASLIGAYGLTYVTVFLAAAPALLLDPVSRRARAAVAGLALAALAGLYGFGSWRLAHAVQPSATAPLVRIVQANIDQKDKWKPENLPQVFATYRRLTAAPAAATPDVVVWPEGALPAVIDDLLYPGSPYLDGLVASLRPGQTLMMGANRAGLGPNGKIAYYNSLIAFRREPGPGGLRVTGIYDKHRLVPFGEFLPAGEFATRWGIRSLVHMPDDFTPGPEPLPLRPLGLPPVQPLICYEALFPRVADGAAARAGERAAWLLNVSNDAWFGQTSGPWQHLNIAGYRAIEAGLPLVRATPTGVSVVLDAYGRAVDGKRLKLGQEGVIDARLPPALPSTTYSKRGEIFLAAALLVSLVLAAARHRLTTRPPYQG